LKGFPFSFPSLVFLEEVAMEEERVVEEAEVAMEEERVVEEAEVAMDSRLY